MDAKKTWKKVWHFIWEDNSIWSWIANVALAFVLIKFIVYPSLGFVFQTTHPVVAVVSESMEHRTDYICIKGQESKFLGASFTSCSQSTYTMCGNTYEESRHYSLEDYWQECGSWYRNVNITKEDFFGFSMKRGFNKGDIMVLRGSKPENIQIGDIIVFWSIKRDPIIHRVVKKWKEYDEKGKKYAYHFQTKGDNNINSIKNIDLDETNISEEQIIGKAVLRVPLLGYIKIAFVKFLGLFGLSF